MKSGKSTYASVSILTAITASLCCITPLLAIIAGSSGLASSFSWLEPFRPYLIGLTILVLAFSWYQKLKQNSKLDCECETENKPKFIQSKLFLTIVTVFAGLMLAFPHYAHIFYPNTNNNTSLVTDASNIEIIEFKIQGMTCGGCEAHIENEVNKLGGIISVNADYENSSTKVEFDNTKSNTNKIEQAILKTGYKIVKD